ncbi:putative E3 ubiquitin-protein ligase UBR7 [Hypsibius exemplaris]|uniref:E3 ubiquitin-protein ligase UBR7 n=1 Tax=Hypsibius exemplaris TaxID=2072580 RepID=A0A1W0WTF7_HYPEX|nr:putative E3 ubiquitin-protein ligase UBR7 [Hypsibius exemplaris]
MEKDCIATAETDCGITATISSDASGTNESTGEILSQGKKRPLEKDSVSSSPPTKETKHDQSSLSSGSMTCSVPFIPAAQPTQLLPESGQAVGGSAPAVDSGIAAADGENGGELVLTLTQGLRLGQLIDQAFARQLQEDEDEDEDAADVAAVLGDCSDELCSYDKGYMKRQALYSCVTCYNKTKEVAGICLACSYACHDGHEFVELYTKRNFRCDCGNSKFSGMACKLTPNKDVINERNQYNNNFLNAYCTCQRPYPDPEAKRDDLIQVQCTFCEDWFHLQHELEDTTDVEALVETPKSLICRACRQKHAFTNYYVAEESDLVGEFDAALSECQIDGCGLKFLQKKFDPLPAIDGGGWTPLDWYSSVCRCDTCKQLYAEEKVEFLLDPEESVAVHEEKGRARVALERQETRARMEEGTEESALQELLTGMDRFQQIEFASGVSDMKAGLNAFLADFANRGETIRPEHISEFFEQERKKLEEKNLRRNAGGDL